MNWMAWASIACALLALGCFLRGAFELSWDCLPWLFTAAVSGAAGIVFGICWAFA